jgi:hypothetical protein
MKKGKIMTKFDVPKPESAGKRVGLIAALNKINGDFYRKEN